MNSLKKILAIIIYIFILIYLIAQGGDWIEMMLLAILSIFPLFFTTIDVTDAKKDHDELYIVKSVLDNGYDGVMITDKSNQIIYVNKAFENITGYKRNEVMGKNPRVLQSKVHDGFFYEEMWKSILENGCWNGEIWNKRKDGKKYLQQLVIKKGSEPYSKKNVYFATFNDITEKKEAENKLIIANQILEGLSNLDGLTGIPNRRYFEESIRIEWEIAMENQMPLSLLMIDIDYFKEFNDTYGHLEGDDCLKKIARVIQDSVSVPKGICARYGGDEFVVILPNTTHEDAEQMGVKICEDVKEMNISHLGSHVDQRVTISVGCGTVVPKAGVGYIKLIDLADIALYKSKKSGRNKISI